MRKITLNVCQGVGDIFWVYRKFAPHYDVLDFNILVIEKNENGPDPKIQNRAIPFVKSWPKTGSVNLVLSNGRTYMQLAKSTFDMRKIIESKEKETFYSCNKPLEDGIRLEQIDGDLEVLDTVAFPLTPVKLPEKYLCFYTSGSNPPLSVRWSIHDWVRYIKSLYQMWDKPELPIVMIGAEYDERRLKYVADRLPYDVTIYIEKTPPEVYYILKHAHLFVGYQSGLNILADNLDTSQVMLYFPRLKNLRFSWPKQRNIDAGIYRAFTFMQSPDEVAAATKNITIPCGQVYL